MLKVFSKELEPLGVLENVYNATVDREANELWHLSFSLPADDPKNELCQHFNFIDAYGDTGRYYGKYRIMPKDTKKSEDSNRITYECEHVLATLLDDVMLDYHQYTNFTTEEVLQFILELQTTEHWVLGDVQFERRFHYGFENENGLLAPILSIPKIFDEPYLFTFDTTSYPWTLNLVRPSNNVVWDIRWGRDMVNFDEVSDPEELANRIYPKGYGEGVNQLTIVDVNDGVPYVEDQESIDRWGLHSWIWVDRRFDNAENLKASAQSMLTELKNPKISFEIDAADLSVKPEYEHMKREFFTVGEIHVDDKVYKARIIGEQIRLDEEYNPNYTVSNRINNIATTQADLERKVQVNEAYSQGATNIDSHDYQDNCDENNPAVIRFYLDEDLVNINTMNLTFEVEQFRAYSQATEGGGGITTTSASGGGTTATSSSGGGTTATSSSGGGTSTSTQSGGGSSQTSSAGGDHDHIMFQTTGNNPGTVSDRVAASAGAHTIYFAEGTPTQTAIRTHQSSGNHSHGVSIPNHSHDFSTPNHTHNVTIPNHTHDVTIPNHTHQIELPDHTHEIRHGIYKLSSLPSVVEIQVDGNTVPHSGLNGTDIDLIPYLSVDGGGKIQRGTWHEVTITPNGLARVNAQIISRFFIQSRIGGVF